MISRLALLSLAFCCVLGVCGCGDSKVQDKQPKLQGPPDPKIKGPATPGGADPGNANVPG